MKRLFLLAIFVLALAVPIKAQPWSGILSPSRAIDWTIVGVPGGIPSGSWTQCGPTIAAYSGTATLINNALNHTGAGYTGCAANTYILLGAGIFNLSTAINFGHASNTLLRGAGADTTFIVFGAGISLNCASGFAHTLVCMDATSNVFSGSATFVNVSSGLSQGSTSLVLSTLSGITITPNQSIVILTQCDDGKSGNPCTGTSTDNSAFYNCSDAYATTPSGCSLNGPDTGNGNGTAAFQTEMFHPTAVNAGTSTVTLDHPIRLPNWSTSRTARVWVITTPISNSGLENLSIATSDATASSIVTFGGAYGTWIRGVRALDTGKYTWNFIASMNFTVESNYADNSRAAAGTDGAAFHSQNDVGSCLIQNNISRKFIYHWFEDSPDDGCVFAYNFMVNNFNNSSGMAQSIRPHAGGDDFELYEGNIGANYYNEVFHGTHLMHTTYRNFFYGYESCVNGNCGAFTSKTFLVQAHLTNAFNRYGNAVANVLGTPGVHNTYQCTTIEQSCPLHTIWTIGTGNSATSPPVPADSVAINGFMRWGNYDVVNNAVLECTGVSTPTANCLGDERADGSTNFPGLTNPSTTFPASFYLSSRPSWWSALLPFPAIGPDVTGGNISQCGGTLDVTSMAKLPATFGAQCGSGTISAAWGGHVNVTPAAFCYFTIGGTPDGTGGPFPFNANTCYANAGTPAVELSPASLNFGNVAPLCLPSNLCPQLTMTVTNTGTAGLTFAISNALTISPNGNTPAGDFQLVVGNGCSNGASIPVGVSCGIFVSFSPSLQNVQESATVTLTNNAPNSPQVFAVTGIGLAPSPAPSFAGIQLAGRMRR